MAGFFSFIRNRLSSVLLLWALLLGFLVQAPLARLHETSHFSERLSISTHSQAVIDSSGCIVCDAVHLVPETPSMHLALDVTSYAGEALPLPPVFLSDNAILLPLGARAPPARITSVFSA